MSKVTQIGSDLWSVSRAASKAGSGHEKRSVCGSEMVFLPLCTLTIPQGAQSKQVPALTPLGRKMGEPYDMTFPSVRNRMPWKPASLWPGLLHKLIFAFSQPLPLSADPSFSPPLITRGHLTPLLPFLTAKLLLLGFPYSRRP